jgi:hypothetical protein
MNTATFDIVNVLNRELKDLGVPATTLATLAGISSGKMSSYLNGITPVPNEHDLKLRLTWASLKKLISSAAPLPIDYRRAAKLRESLDLLESGALQIVVFEQQTIT